MDPHQIQHYWLCAALGALCAAGGVFGFFRSWRRERILEDTPLVRIRSAAQGYVKLAGRCAAATAAATPAPLSGRPCVWWSYKIEKRVRDSRGRSRWSAIENATSVAPFLLIDDGAQCLVGPVNAEVLPTGTDIWQGNAPRPLGPPTLRRTWLSPEMEFRYTEKLITVDAHLSVLGELRSHTEITSLDVAARALLTQWKQDQRSLLKRFDTNHDGRLDADEWERARRAAVADAQSRQLKDPTPDRISVVAQPTGDEPFLIAPLSDAQLEGREKHRALAFLAASLAGAALCGWALHRLI